MDKLKNKRIIVGVSGSIAAYKSPLLVRELIKAGAHVNVVMTPSAAKFVAPIALTSVSKNPVAMEMFDENLQNGGAWHVQLAHWADLMIIAPASATTLSKLAQGNCDTALACVATAMPRNIPLLIAPAMDFTMWDHPATQRNVEILKSYGAKIIMPESGELASGLVGPGRLPDIPVLIDNIIECFENKAKEKPVDVFASPKETLQDSIDKNKWNAEMELQKLKSQMNVKDSDKFLSGKKVVITAGPTRENIDGVRFIANYSSGKMGYALAKAARNAGAEVVLISGPVSINPPERVKTINVISAEDMYNVAVNEFIDSDIAIMSAAVADYTPAYPQAGKIKKSEQGEALVLELKPTKDILKELGERKKSNQIVLGFALESENELEYGRKKLEQKNCDMIVVNSANKPGSGFAGDDNTITILSKDQEVKYDRMSKDNCALKILEYIRNFGK